MHLEARLGVLILQGCLYLTGLLFQDFAVHVECTMLLVKYLSCMHILRIKYSNKTFAC